MKYYTSEISEQSFPLTIRNLNFALRVSSPRHTIRFLDVPCYRSCFIELRPSRFRRLPYPGFRYIKQYRGSDSRPQGMLYIPVTSRVQVHQSRSILETIDLEYMKNNSFPTSVGFFACTVNSIAFGGTSDLWVMREYDIQCKSMEEYGLTGVRGTRESAVPAMSMSVQLRSL